MLDKLCEVKNTSIVNKIVNGKLLKPGQVAKKVPESKLDMNEVTNKRLAIIGESEDLEEEKEKEAEESIEEEEEENIELKNKKKKVN